MYCIHSKDIQQMLETFTILFCNFAKYFKSKEPLVSKIISVLEIYKGQVCVRK